MADTAYNSNTEGFIGGLFSTFLGPTSSWSFLSQAFTTTSSYLLRSVRLYLNSTTAGANDGPPDNGKLTIYKASDDGSGVPDGPALGQSIINTTGLGDTNYGDAYQWLSFAFATPVSLSNSTEYVIVLNCMAPSGGGRGTILWGVTGPALEEKGNDTNFILYPNQPEVGDWDEISASNDFMFEALGLTAFKVNSVPAPRPGTYNEDDVYNPATQTWGDINSGNTVATGGGRYQNRLVCFNGQGDIYFGDA